MIHLRILKNKIYNISYFFLFPLSLGIKGLPTRKGNKIYKIYGCMVVFFENGDI